VTTVLVVDDQPIVREVVLRYLERGGRPAISAARKDSEIPA
jgi:CheY-like chemotaxis protein